MGEGDRVARERDAMDRVQDMVEVKVKERERDDARFLVFLPSSTHLLDYNLRLQAHACYPSRFLSLLDYTAGARPLSPS